MDVLDRVQFFYARQTKLRKCITKTTKPWPDLLENHVASWLIPQMEGGVYWQALIGSHPGDYHVTILRNRSSFE